MTPKAFFDIVSQMRYAQKSYSATNNAFDLCRVQSLEEIVDKEIERVNKILQNR